MGLCLLRSRVYWDLVGNFNSQGTSNSEKGDSVLLQNVNTHLPDYTASLLSSPQYESSPSWNLQITKSFGWLRIRNLCPKKINCIQTKRTLARCIWFHVAGSPLKWFTGHWFGKEMHQLWWTRTFRYFLCKIRPLKSYLNQFHPLHVIL
jgi:hypothetical protein